MGCSTWARGQALPWTCWAASDKPQYSPTLDLVWSTPHSPTPNLGLREALSAVQFTSLSDLPLCKLP